MYEPVLKKLEFSNFSWEEIVFPTNNCRKTVVFSTFWKDKSEIIKKIRLFLTYHFLQFLAKFQFISRWNPGGGIFFYFGLGPLCPLCLSPVGFIFHLGNSIPATITPLNCGLNTVKCRFFKFWPSKFFSVFVNRFINYGHIIDRSSAKL